MHSPQRSATMRPLSAEVQLEQDYLGLPHRWQRALEM